MSATEAGEFQMADNVPPEGGNGGDPQGKEEIGNRDVLSGFPKGRH